MKVVTPEFNKKKDPAEQVISLATEHIPQLVSEHDFTQALFIGANEENMMFLSNLSAAELNLLIDVAKQYVLLGE